jgi:release factor glutamine methyltransferase
MTSAGRTHERAVPPWTVKAALDWTQGHLQRKSEANPRLSAQWLLSLATSLTRLELYTHFDQELEPEELTRLREAIKRRVAGEPLQYIRGTAPFRHLELRVRPGVLIPRPETELLVQLVLDWLASRGRAGAPSAPSPSPTLGNAPASLGLLRGAPLAPATLECSGADDWPTSREQADARQLLDLCTGGGCVALSLLQEFPGLRVTATDVDPVAVGLARENAQLLGLTGPQLTVLQDDLATGLLQDPATQGSFDVVVANPPYIPTAELSELPAEVRDFEPFLALDGGADGLDIFRGIAAQAAALLKPGGLLACELHESTLEQAAALLEQDYVDIAIRPDLNSRPRVITATRKEG